MFSMKEREKRRETVREEMRMPVMGWTCGAFKILELWQRVSYSFLAW